MSRQAATESRAPGREGATPTTVLVVDDHNLVAESLTRALNAESDLVVVGTAESGTRALEAVRELRPDVVVMDYRLPDGTGAEATARIKAELPATDVVMLTGAASGASLADALEAGCSGFVAKEGRFEELVHTIRAVVAGEVRVPQRLVEELAAHLRPRSAGLGADLTRREREVLSLLAVGSSTSQMVDALTVSIHTVRNHIRNILTKLNARSRLEAVAIAIRIGILDSEDSSGGRGADGA
jgi:DNA-binding NarL/FixJ family response regulator